MTEITTAEQRLWAGIQIAGPDDCWLWTRSVRSSGYGQMSISNRKFSPHRLAYEFAKGAIPGDLCVLHRCDVKRCCNPRHLFLGTRGDNAADRERKGRTKKGDDLPQSRLTAAQVREIRERVAKGEKHQALADQLGVACSTVSLAVEKRTWAHV